MNRLFYKGLWNKGQCILNFNVYLGVVSQPKTSGTVKSFNFNMSDLSSWDSNVTFPFLLQCAPGVIPYFGPERLERVDRMIIKVPPTHLIIWQYLVGEVGDEGFLKYHGYPTGISNSLLGELNVSEVNVAICILT